MPESLRRQIEVENDESDDTALWAAAVRGEPAAFGDLFDRYADLVYRYALVRVRQADIAEEIVSTVFIEAWRQRSRIELQGRVLRPWLLGVARNQANWHLGRLYRRSLDARPPDPAAAGAVAAIDPADAVASRVDAPAELERVLAMLDALPDGAREVLVLHVWGELSHEDIALALGVSVGTVKSRLSRARRRLRLRPSAATGEPPPRPADRLQVANRGEPADRRQAAAPRQRIRVVELDDPSGEGSLA